MASGFNIVANFHILANLMFFQGYFWRFMSSSMVSWSPSFVGYTWLPRIVIAKANHANLAKTIQITFHTVDQ